MRRAKAYSSFGSVV